MTMANESDENKFTVDATPIDGVLHRPGGDGTRPHACATLSAPRP